MCNVSLHILGDRGRANASFSAAVALVAQWHRLSAKRWNADPR